MRGTDTVRVDTKAGLQELLRGLGGKLTGQSSGCHRAEKSIVTTRGVKTERRNASLNEESSHESNERGDCVLIILAHAPRRADKL